MAYYRLYFHDREGRIVNFVDFECADDAAALARAAEHAGEHAMELWNQDRLVRRFARGEG